MNKTQALKNIKECKKQMAAAHKAKTYKGEWYTINSLFGNDWARWFLLLGGREAGKSYAVMRWAVINKLRRPDSFKFYWFRLTDASQKKLLAGGGTDFIDPDLQKKFGVKTLTKGNKICTYKETTRINKNGREVTEKTDIKEFARVMSCSTFYNDKGVGYFDSSYEGEYLVVLDEMNREGCEANRFDIVYAFCNQLENVLRSTKNKVRVVCIGNTLDEAGDILSAFNFIPDTFGRYKLHKNHNHKFDAIIDYIRPNEQYLKRRKDALANELAGDSSTFTNEVEIDRSLLVNKRKCNKPTAIIKFAKTPKSWYTVWNGNIIKQYNNENLSNVIAMSQYLDEVYNRDLMRGVIDRFDARAYLFTDIATFKRFQKSLRTMKRK